MGPDHYGIKDGKNIATCIILYKYIYIPHQLNYDLDLEAGTNSLISATTRVIIYDPGSL